MAGPAGGGQNQPLQSSRVREGTRQRDAKLKIQDVTNRNSAAERSLNFAQGLKHTWLKIKPSTQNIHSQMKIQYVHLECSEQKIINTPLIQIETK